MGAAFRGRREDARLITGRGKYTTDWNLPGQLHGVFLRADRAHARICGIDVSAALAMPGVHAVYTGADAQKAGMKAPPSFVAYPGRGGEKIRNPAWTAIAVDKVRYVGELVALVVADSAAIAQDASERIAVDYEDLSPVVDADEALAPGAALLHDDVPGNLCFDYEYGDEARAKSVFDAAAHVTRVALVSQRLVGNPMEPRSCLAAWNAERGVYDVYASTQGMSMMRGSLAAFSNVPPEKIRIHAHDVGGGFGIRSGAYPEYPVLMHAAKALGRPVKWTGTRSETIATDYHGRALRMEGELALDKAGNFLGIRIFWVCNQGAYLTGAGPLINTANGPLTAVGVYRIPVVYGRHRLVLTNTAPITAYRGAGRPDMAYLVERLVDQAALDTGADRLELRRRNFIPKDAFPYKTPTAEYDSGDYAGLLDLAVKHSDWAGFEARRAESARRGRLRGMNCAVFVEPSGGGVAPKDQIAIKFGASQDGSARPVTIYSMAGPSGQGHETTFSELIGGVLGISAEDIEVRGSDPDGPPLMGNSTIGSRTLLSQGSAMLRGAQEVIQKGMALAAEELEAAEADIEYAGGEYRVKGTDRRIRLLDLAKRRAGGDGNPLDSGGEIEISRAFPAGAHVAEVEIDPATGVIEVARYTAVDDCGKVINHTLVEGQIHGGLAQGAGQVFGESCVYDRASGQLMTGSFMDYYMPRAGYMRSIELHDHSVPSPNNPLGVKGVGEAGTTGALPTLMNAILDALRPAGVKSLDMPATPARVWEALRAARSR